MEYFKSYISQIKDITDKIEGNAQQYEEAAALMLERIKKDGLIYSFGTGHGHLLALEIFYRAGGLARVCPILEEDFMLHKSATGSSDYERTEGNAEKIFRQYSVSANDVFIIFSNSGINPLTIEMAQLAKKAGALTIALTNLNHSRPLASRASSGLKLYDICDIVLDNFGKLGDSAVETKQSGSIAPTSTAAGSIILHGLMAMVVELAEKQGAEIEVLVSGNIPQGHERSKRLIEAFKPRIKAL